MNTIELERWVPTEENPRKLKYAGQPAAEEVFQELKHRLEGMGYLPDEYFLMDMHWEGGREIPRGADVFCTTDYGESEGVYLDVYLKWHEDGKPIIKNFITGKTLGDSGDDLDRMFLISSAITKAFHGGEATHARYMKVGGIDETTGGSVVHLNQKEQRTIIEALVEQRERQENAMSQTEQLLRRMTGSITGYMDAVGQRPLRLSDYDKAALAIRDRELAAFKELWPKVTDHADELLVETAARSGNAARRMMDVMLSGEQQFSEGAYRTACQKAVNATDDAMLDKLLTQAERHMDGYTPALWGETAHYGYQHSKEWFARQIADWCGPEQIAAAPPALLVDTVRADDFYTARRLAEGGISADSCFAEIVQYCSAHNCEQQIGYLLEHGLNISPDNFRALHACIEHECLDAGKQLLERGMNLDEYKDWAKGQSHGLCENDALNLLEEHWQEIQAQAQEQSAGEGQETATPEIGGMTLG